MYEDAVQTALNVLAVLEEDSPAKSRELRRLLPALSVSFARAGTYISERDMLQMIHTADEQKIPLRAMFAKAHPSQREYLTYEAIASRLNKDFKTPITVERAILFGNLEKFQELEQKNFYKDDNYQEYAHTAAKRGFIDFCRYCIQKTHSPVTTTSSALIMAAKEEQHHVIYTLLGEAEKYTSLSLQEDLKGVMTDDKYSDYRAFERLYKDFKKSNPSVKPEYFTGIQNWQNINLRLRPYLQIREILANEISNIKEVNLAAFKATLVFQSQENVLRFLDKWGEASKTPLKDLLQDVHPPMTRFVNWSSWGDALIKYGPQMFFPLQFAQQLIEPVCNAEGMISLKQTRQVIWEKFYPATGEEAEIAKLCFKHETKYKVLDKALKLWSKASHKQEHPTVSIPDINISCDYLGLEGYRVVKISHRDPRIMFLGYYTGCCEKIGDHFEPTSEHALLTNQSSYYIVVKDDEIKAHSWVWRGEGGQIIIDGWETDDPEITPKDLESLTDRISTELEKPEYESYGITDVLIGLCGNDITRHMRYPIATEVVPRFACEWYFPEPSQWLVKRFSKPDVYDVFKPE